MTLKHGWKLHARGAVWRNFGHLADMAEDVRYQSDVELTFNFMQMLLVLFCVML